MDFKKYLNEDIAHGWVYGVSESFAKINRIYYNRHMNSIKTSEASERYDIVKRILETEDSRQKTIDLLNELKEVVSKKAKKEVSEIDEFICNVITEKDIKNDDEDLVEYLVALKANEIDKVIYFIETYWDL